MKSIIAYSLIPAIALVSALVLEDEISEKVVVLPLSLEKNKNFSGITNSSFAKRRFEPVPLINEFYTYEADIVIGNPGQPQRVHIDTGSPNLWVYHKSVSKAEQTFDPDSSSTFRLARWSFIIKYVYGWVTGYWASDTVRIGDFTIEDQMFGIATEYNIDTGVLGLGYPPRSGYLAHTLFTPVPDSLYLKGLTRRNVYSLFLNDAESSAGTLIFGGVDSRKYTGPFKTFPTSIIGELSLTVFGLSVDDGVIPEMFDVILDSGASFTYVPESVFSTIVQYYGAKWDASVQWFVVEELPFAPLVFHFGELSISVDPSEIFFTELASDDNYGLAILPNSKSGGHNLLGATFLRSAYVVFDLERDRISIAQSSFNSAESDIIPVIDDIPGATYAFQ